jgi:glycine oxidase
VSAGDVVTDLVVVGGGLIGLAAAAAAAERGLIVALLSADRPGAASRAGAGLLVPHYGGEAVQGEVAHFMAAARDLYPSYVRWLEERSGARVPFQSSGALQVARTEAECAALQSAAPADAVRLDPRDVAEMEPSLAPTAGGVLYPRDGAVDNVGLTDALAFVIEHDRHVHLLRDSATRIDLDNPSPTVTSASGVRLRGSHVVLAAGAWSAGIDGLPRPIPVRPLRGQLCSIDTAPLRHVVLGPDVYMATRSGDRTLVGSTMEEVGFDPGTTAAAIADLRRAAVASCPILGGERVLAAWSGLRPATPDLLPILGTDPDNPRLIYACGHSRNGILLTPITAFVTAAIVAGEKPRWDLSPFSIRRFDGTGSAE